VLALPIHDGRRSRSAMIWWRVDIASRWGLRFRELAGEGENDNVAASDRTRGSRRKAWRVYAAWFHRHAIVEGFDLSLLPEAGAGCSRDKVDGGDYGVGAAGHEFDFLGKAGGRGRMEFQWPDAEQGESSFF